ncbi:MAG: hypothetical protein EOP53_00455 [Sphingobacteriales bacterium]|nr:MAG: hypothetical protein EOP53_00455 [Sphingobacteriales bacterium]
MKSVFRAIFCVIVFFCNAQFIFSQEWKSAFDKGMEDMQRADDIGRGKNEITEAEHSQKLKLYNSATASFISARENNRKMAAASTYFIATTLFKASLEESALGNDADAYVRIKRAIEFWPSLSVVPASKFISEQNVRVNGKRQTYNALGDAEDWQHAYFKSYIRATQLANTLKKYDEAIGYAEYILDVEDTLNKENFIAWCELSKAYKSKNDYCQSAEYAMKAIEGALVYKRETAEDKQILKDYLPEMAVNISPPKGCKFDVVKWEERAALALARLHNIEDQSFYVLIYGQDAYNRGRQNTELLVALAEAEFYQSQLENATETEKTNWFGKIQERKSSFNSDELIRVAGLYRVRGNFTKEQELLRKSKRKRYWENTHFAFSTNPVNFYWGQYVGAFDFMLPRHAHEIRVNYNTKSRHVFWKNAQDKTPGPLEFYYKGYELSYTLKFMEKDIKRVKGRQYYSGPQFRIENRNYFPETVDIIKDNTIATKYEKTMSNLSSNRYEAILMVGLQRRTPWLFLDYFFGVGLGYKTFVTDKIEANETVADDRFVAGLWNKTYVPVHAGIRVGLILK